ncbi:hypothetical protein LXA43DRAFT_1143257 [Ganoderma leucocontextum]|nr:hypothetical protein LXA43DRAFT_1143257 [Ganoderma leucocontextum]
MATIPIYLLNTLFKHWQIIPLSPPSLRPRQIPSIPIDVLQEILLHLPFKDRLNVSVLSKTIYAVFPPRPTRVVVGSFTQLASLAAYISDDPTRISSLRSLHILIYSKLSWETTSYEDTQENLFYTLENARNLEELVCRGAAASGLMPATLTMSRRLAHVELKGLPRILTGTEPSQHFFPPTLQSVHFTGRKCYSDESHHLDHMLRLVSHLPSLETFVVEDYTLSSYRPGTTHQEHGAQSETGHNVILPSVQTLKFIGCSHLHFKLVSEISRSFPNLTTLHFKEMCFPTPPPEYSVDHLVIQDGFRGDRPVPWKIRRLTCTHEVRDHITEFSLPGCGVDISNVLCLTIKARIISPRIWIHLSTLARAARLVELESSSTTFAELVMWLIERPGLPVTPADVPLICISISTHDLEDPWHGPREKWEQKRNEVLQTASKHFLSLRYVAMATPKPPAHIAPTPAFPGDDTPVWTWWRVHRDSAGSLVEIREIPVWEGQRVREFLRNSDADALKNFDRTFVALR